MKRFLVLLIFALAAIGFTGCFSDDSDSTKADLRWINKHGVSVTDIQWMTDGTENQKWTGSFTDYNSDQQNATTGYKGISKLTGTGECIFVDGTAGGQPQPIELINSDSAVTGLTSNGTNSVTVAENASATLVVGPIGKK